MLWLIDGIELGPSALQSSRKCTLKNYVIRNLDSVTLINNDMSLEKGLVGKLTNILS